jgi:hypothetical protein
MKIKRKPVMASRVMGSSDPSVEIIDAANKILSGAERYGVVLEEFNCDPDNREITFQATCLGKPVNWYNINSFSDGSVMISKGYEGSNVTLNSWDDAARYCISDFRNYTKWLPSSSSRTSGKAVMATKRPIKAAAAGHDPWYLIEQDRAKVIKEWSETYDGTPNTSWDNIFDNVLDDFKRYADDEASGNILDDFIEGDFDEYDMLTEFYQFIMFRDMNDYDF